MGGRWGRYPACKLVLSGQKSGTGEAVQVLVKMNVAPNVFPPLYSLLKVCNAEIRECWKGSAGIVPETVVVPGLASRELALTLPGPKRRRDGLQSPGTRMLVGCSVKKPDHRNATHASVAKSGRSVMFHVPYVCCNWKGTPASSFGSLVCS